MKKSPSSYAIVMFGALSAILLEIPHASEVDLDSINSPSFNAAMLQSPYRRGLYMSANLIYHSQTSYIKQDGTSTPASWYVGVEFLHGEKDNLNSAFGEDQRVQVTGGAKF